MRDRYPDTETQHEENETRGTDSDTEEAKKYRSCKVVTASKYFSVIHTYFLELHAINEWWKYLCPEGRCAGSMPVAALFEDFKCSLDATLDGKELEFLQNFLPSQFSPSPLHPITSALDAPLHPSLIPAILHWQVEAQTTESV